jgi:hypothetical protein
MIRREWNVFALAGNYSVCQKKCPFGRKMPRILKSHRDGRFAVIPAEAGIQTGPGSGSRMTLSFRIQTKILAIAIIRNLISYGLSQSFPSFQEIMRKRVGSRLLAFCHFSRLPLSIQVNHFSDMQFWTNAIILTSTSAQNINVNFIDVTP